MLEHERSVVADVTACSSTSPKKVDPLSRSLSSAGQSYAKGSEAQDRPMASGVLGRDPGQSPQCIPETHSIGYNPQKHSILSIAVLRIVPRATMCGHDLEPKLLMVKSRMWPDGPLAMIKVDI